MELTIGNGKYMLKDKIGTGAFSHVFAGQDIKYDQDVAIKLEEKKNKKQLLFYEAKLLKYLLQVYIQQYINLVPHVNYRDKNNKTDQSPKSTPCLAKANIT